MLLPVPQLALPCLILAEIITKAGLECFVYISSFNELKEISSSCQPRIDVVFSGCRKKIQDLPNSSYNVKLSKDSKLTDIISAQYFSPNVLISIYLLRLN